MKYSPANNNLMFSEDDFPCPIMKSVTVGDSLGLLVFFTYISTRVLGQPSYEGLHDPDFLKALARKHRTGHVLCNGFGIGVGVVGMNAALIVSKVRETQHKSRRSCLAANGRVESDLPTNV